MTTAPMTMDVATQPAPAGARPAGPAGTVAGLLTAAAVAAPDRPAIKDGSGAWTYREFDEQVDRVAGWLAAQGVQPGDRVVVRLPNCRELAAVLFGIARAGAAFVPLSAGMKDFHLRAVLADCTPALIIAAERAVPLTEAVTDVPVVGVDSLWAKASTGPHESFVDAGTPDGLAALMYTSGSTALPKGVICPHAQVVFAAGAIASMLGIRSDDVVFSRIPLPFDYGLYQLFLSCLARAELVLSGAESDVTLLARIAECGATVVPIVPSLASALALLAEREGAVAAVRLTTNTGAALPDAVIDGLRTAFPNARVVRMYGITECKRVTIMPPEQDRERPGSSGIPLPGTEVTILDDDGAPVPAGVVGQITVTGPHVMGGYRNLPELSAGVFRVDPATGGTRLHTGDYGRVDEDGYLYFDGRRDDMFKRKTVRMSTIEIEAAAMDIPGVRAACALPPTDERDLVLCADTDLAPGAVLRELAARLEAAKVPAACHVVTDFPLSSNGKTDRAELRRRVDEVRA